MNQVVGICENKYMATDLDNNLNAPETPQDEPEPTYEELLAKITNTNKLAFLMAFPTHQITKQTARAVGLAEDTPFEWCRRDSVFRDAMLALKKRIDSHRLEQLERELHTRSMGGTSKQSDILLMFSLKSLEPGRYRESIQAIPFIGTINVVLSTPRPGANLELPTKEPKQLKEGGK